MLEIFKKALGFDTLPVVVDENSKGTANCDIKLACWRHKTRDQAQEITTENKEADSSDHGQVFFSFFSHVINQKSFKCLNDKFQGALAFGRNNLKVSRCEPEKEDEKYSHDQYHDDIIGNQMFGMLDFDSHQAKEQSNGFSEDFIEEIDYE